MMLTKQDYKNKVKDCKKINKDNMYDIFTDTELKIIKQYFELFTRYEYRKMRGTLKLDILPDKVEKLKELKGEGSWEFVGLEDMQKRGLVKCELGHSIRYVYKARNVDNGAMLYFGSHCVGDFFCLDNVSIQIMNRLKVMMLSEVESMAVIKALNLLDEYLFYECEKLGTMFELQGIDGIEKCNIDKSVKTILKDFYINKIPFPKSLIQIVESYNSQIEKVLYDLSNYDINLDDLETLKQSPITLISNMFTFSENDVLNTIKRGMPFDRVSDFYNFLSPSDLSIACHIWKNRNIRIINAQNYFKSIGITDDWVLLYRKMIENNFNQNIDFYQAVELLMMFDKDINIDFTLEVPHTYKYQGYYLNKGAYEKFDMLIDYLSTKEFFQNIKEVQGMLEHEKSEIDKENKKIEEMMTFLREHVEDECYRSIKGIGGIYDIVIVKKKEFDSMSIKQQRYVLSVYDMMLEVNKKSEQDNKGSDGTFINKKYSLVERPDVLAKIQQLQLECYDNLTTLQQNIIHSIMSNHTMTDRQIAQIEKAYSKNVLHEKEEQRNVVLDMGTSTNKKFSLLERQDIKEKIEELMGRPDYYNIPMEVRNIFSNILKYKRVSEKQAKTVENTYRRYIGHD